MLKSFEFKQNSLNSIIFTQKFENGEEIETPLQYLTEDDITQTDMEFCQNVVEVLNMYLISNKTL